MKIRRPPQGQLDSPRRGRHVWRHLSRLSPRKAVTLRLYKLNGSELMFCVESRGLKGYITGDVGLYDVWAAITNNL